MTTFLLVISFLIHALSLFALILLFQRQNSGRNAENKMKQAANETEEMLTAFLMEMKEENEKLIEDLKKAQALEKPAQTKKREPMPDPVLPPVTPRKAAAQAYKQTTKHSGSVLQEQHAEKPLIDQMVDLQKSGLSKEEIAKKLNVGRTEVELAFKFNKKE